MEQNQSLQVTLHNAEKPIGYRTHTGCEYYDKDLRKCTNRGCIFIKACAAKKNRSI